jgi:hypothetical protein
VYNGIQIIPDSYEQVVHKDKGVSVHRLTELKGDRMITEGKEVTLVSGPSREEFFDSIRLGSSVKELRVVEFYYEKKDEKGRSGGLLRIQIEGTHVGGNEGRAFFFWGKLKQITSGESWVPAWEAKDVSFVFGTWDTHRRSGKVQFGDKSFFKNPFIQKETGQLTSEEIMERFGRLCRLGTSVMCRFTFPLGPSKWYVSLDGVKVPVHTMDMSGSTPEEAIVNAWRAVTDPQKSLTLIRYFCKRSDEPVPPENTPQVWVRWNHEIDDWEDVEPPKNDSHATWWASRASEIRPYANHKAIEANY